MPILPNVLPNVDMSFSEGSAARLENGRAAVGGDLHLTYGVAEEECEGHGLSLHHTATWGEHLSDAPDFVHLAFVEGARDNSGDNNTRALVVGGACGVSAENQVGSVHRVAWAPNPCHAGQQGIRLKGRESSVVCGWQATYPQRLSRLMAQRASTLRALRSGEKNPLPHHAQGCEVVGAFGLRLGQFPGDRPVNTTVGSSACILLGDAAIRSGLEEPPQGFLNPMCSGEARCHLDGVPLKPPEPCAVEAPFGEAPGGGVTCFNTKVLEVGDHGRDWPFN